MKINNYITPLENKHVFAVAALLLVGAAVGIGTTLDQDGGESDDLQVVATFYPLYDIGQNIGGDEASFSTLVSPGTDPHSFDPSPRDIQGLKDADIFVATGAEFEEWEKDMVEEVRDDAVIVDPSERIDLVLADETPDPHHDHGHDHDGDDQEHHEDEHHDEEEHHDEHHDDEHHGEEDHHDEHHEDEHHGEHDHSHGRYDPHYWLSPQNAIVIAEEIGKALQEVDEENAEHYSENLENYVGELEALDQEYEERLSDCEQDTILITHPAFAYLGQDYGFKQVPVSGIGHLTEPSPHELQDLVREAEEHGLEYIFYDPVTEADAAETIASEIDAETLPLHSVEAVENPEQETYLSLMEKNLENLETALEC